ncbi:diguanylate cyclase/phosphodiesterase [Kineococcus radiotolerans SRS30216 = ATCC BAA-149]|uniref:Diguanylate cyclase/phosphodiesterase n=1 Tax=Kineococcus radiotolerans (strain ATCC BAA-149 / DSM 14245 / SRS30216) TaxID=266940 RepID=A6WB72_KINRD|nr:diguanylate cyclase/phosphodiesterase [Kineococcus radiotolerans SRS30216 = ATCC BAA-149]
MEESARRRSIEHAPVRLVLLCVTTAVVALVTQVAVPTGTVLAPPAGGDPWALPVLVVRGVGRVVMFAAAAVVLTWRARTVAPEEAVWRYFSRAAWVATTAAAGAGIADCLSLTGSSSATGAGGLILGLGVLSACPLIYQGLVRWNRHGTLLSEPGDWLNGVGATFTLTAIGNLLLPVLGSPIAQWPMWQEQLWLLRTSAEIVLLGSAATVLNLGGLVRDARAWALVLSFSLVVVIDLAGVHDPVAAAGNGPLSEVGWTVTITTLAVAAVVHAAPPLSRPATTAAPTTGSFVVLLASIAVLAAAGTIGADLPGDAVRAGVVAGVLGGLSVSVRGVQLIRLLADLVTTRREALTDDLTGLANRRALDRTLDEHLRTGRPVSLMLIDLDGFKEVNDRFGHAVGDELLRRAGALLQRVSPPQAVSARLGGDEFAIVLPGSSTEEALALFAVLADATQAPVLIDGRRLLARASVGIATAAGETPEQLLRHADAAMYRAKTAGGAGVAVHDEDAALADEQRARLVEELKVLLHSPDAVDDLDAGAIAVHYQPQLGVGGAVAGAEALVRWQHPRLGLLTPDRFLDLVEEYALMPDLTAQVLREAAGQAAQWHRRGHRLRMSVNLSASCLSHPDLLPLVDGVLAQSGLDSRDLVLEVTETSLMADPQESIARLHDLAGRGIDISIDDYGSGYSSLAYLHDLPASELKLDRSLTRQVTTNPRTADIVAGTVALAHRLGLRVIAEGVEDTTMLHALHALGCDETQGYLHARPMTAEGFDDWLATAGGSTTRSTGTAPVAVPRSTAGL